MCKYCDEHPEPIMLALCKENYWRFGPLPDDEMRELLGDIQFVDISVNPINNDKQSPSLIITSDFFEHMTLPAVPIHYCPMCGRKLD